MAQTSQAMCPRTAPHFRVLGWSPNEAVVGLYIEISGDYVYAEQAWLVGEAPNVFATRFLLNSTDTKLGTPATWDEVNLQLATRGIHRKDSNFEAPSCHPPALKDVPGDVFCSPTSNLALVIAPKAEYDFRCRGVEEQINERVKFYRLSDSGAEELDLIHAARQPVIPLTQSPKALVGAGVLGLLGVLAAGWAWRSRRRAV